MVDKGKGKWKKEKAKTKAKAKARRQSRKDEQIHREIGLGKGMLTDKRIVIRLSDMYLYGRARLIRISFSQAELKKKTWFLKKV